MKAGNKIDVAVNVFAKPFRSSLAILSLLRQCSARIGALWLQFEPVGIKYDQIPAYCIYEYITENKLADCRAYQPETWLARERTDTGLLADSRRRLDLRYQNAFEKSNARLLFLMHNDVFILKDVLGAMEAQMGDAFAIGQLGQCWNCPAANPNLMRDVMNSRPCSPATYLDSRPSHAQLCDLYAKAHEKGIFARPYAVGNEEFARQPWPLPECRINEWACLLNLEKARPLCIPAGPAWPPGAYRGCGEFNLDIGVAWFRDMHAKGLTARNFDLSPYLIHWGGTGNNTPLRYAKGEDKALRILRRHFAPYVEWLENKYRIALPA